MKRVLEKINIDKEKVLLIGAMGVAILGLCFVFYKFYIENSRLIENKSQDAYRLKYTEDKKGGKIKESDIERVHASYTFDVNNMANIVSDADYTFVAKVDKILNPVYKYPAKVDDKWISMPYTKYRLKVIKSIKGNLKAGSYIEILKAGGRYSDSSKYMVYKNDTLPSKGNTYIFSTYVQQDGTLLSTGANSTIKTGNNYKNNNKYRQLYRLRKSKTTKSRMRYKMKNKRVYK